ncbi:hypothetical protein V2J09_006613 [Rumex salicifolius]
MGSRKINTKLYSPISLLPPLAFVFISRKPYFSSAAAADFSPSSQPSFLSSSSTGDSSSSFFLLVFLSVFYCLVMAPKQRTRGTILPSQAAAATSSATSGAPLPSLIGSTPSISADSALPSSTSISDGVALPASTFIPVSGAPAPPLAPSLAPKPSLGGVGLPPADYNSVGGLPLGGGVILATRDVSAVPACGGDVGISFKSSITKDFRFGGPRLKMGVKKNTGGPRVGSTKKRARDGSSSSVNYLICINLYEFYELEFHEIIS